MNVQNDQVTPTEPTGTTIETQEISFEPQAAPVEPVKQEQDAAAKPEADVAEAEQDKGEAGHKKGVQPRIDELTRARREAERQAEYWKQVATAKAQPSAQAAPDKPKADDFKDYGEYVEALTDWKSERAAERAEQKLLERMAEDSGARAAQSKAQTFSERQQQAIARMPDYAEVVGASDTPLAPHVAEALLDSEHGPDLSYQFAKNPDLLIKLNGMSPTAANREIGRLEAAFGNPKAPAPPAPEKRLTTAPQPASTSLKSGASVTPNLADMPMEEYMKARKAQGARWAR